MSALFMIVGVVLAGMIIFASFQTPVARQVRFAAWGVAALVLLCFFTLASFRYIGEDVVGVVTRDVGFKSLPPGKIIATEGEKGPQAEVLSPGWQPWYWPFIYNIETAPLQKVPTSQVGVVSTRDGRPLPPDTTYAPEWTEETKGRMTDAQYFLTDGKGYKGPQATVLDPGTYRINTKLFDVELVPSTKVERAMVGVVKSNVGERPAGVAGETDASASDRNKLVDKGMRGIWREPLLPGEYYLNTKAYEVTPISTMTHVVRYTANQGQRTDVDEETEIMVRTSDGFTFPVDVRLEFAIKPQDAPLIVAMFGDDKENMRGVMNSDVRGIFRNNAQDVKALDYVKDRSMQEEQSLKMLQEVLSKKGISVTAVRIGDVGDEETLGLLLKTQTNREIALQEQETYKQQQLAAAQKKELSRTEQESEEEKRLATANYAVKIAEQDKEKRIIAAGAEAEAIKIEADAQAAAYQKIAEQIGKSNAALIEVLKIVGESHIEITPRVMVVGGGEGADGRNGESTALIGTMLDSMVNRETTPSAPSTTPVRATR